MKRKLLYVAAVAATLAGFGTAYASRASEADSAVLAQAKIGLGQAITAAEQHVKGKAVRAELENENGAPVYGVEVLAGTQSTDVKVDARDGRILSAQADRPDEGKEGEDERDDEDEREGER
jgi:uncharacterized membrane protein YkoI